MNGCVQLDLVGNVWILGFFSIINELPEIVWWFNWFMELKNLKQVLW